MQSRSGSKHRVTAAKSQTRASLGRSSSKNAGGRRPSDALSAAASIIAQASPLPPEPVDPFAVARANARALGSAARLAGVAAVERLYGDEFRDAFGLATPGAWADAADVASIAAARAAARALAKELQAVNGHTASGSQCIPPPAMIVIVQATARPPTDPQTLLEEVLQSLQAMRTPDDELAALGTCFANSTAELKRVWETPGAVELYSDVVASLVDIERCRLEEERARLETKWQNALDYVAKKKVEFETQGFREKAASCAELSRQMTSGLRGLMVQRALRSASLGLESLRSFCDPVACLRGSHMSLPLVSKARVDAQRRIRGLVEVVEREASDAQGLAVRGRLPDGERPPPLPADETVDLWAGISEDEAIGALLARLGDDGSTQAASQADPESEHLEEEVLAAMKRLDVLSSFVGETREAVNELMVMPQIARDSAAVRACKQASGGLGEVVKELASLNEDLLEVLDAAGGPSDAARTSAKAWSSRWLLAFRPDHNAADTNSSSEAPCSGEVESVVDAEAALVDAGMRLGVALQDKLVDPDPPFAVDAARLTPRTPLRRSLLVTIRGIAKLAVDAEVRRRVISPPGHQRGCV